MDGSNEDVPIPDEQKISNSDDNLNKDEVSTESNRPAGEFKKPVLVIGPRKGAHKFTKLKASDTDIKEDTPEQPLSVEVKEKKINKSPAEALQDQNVPLPYKEPKWSSVPDRKYTLEVLKSGVIAETYELTSNYFVFGRATVANCVLAHPSISRYHAVLQYGKQEEDTNPGFYLYDLNSTHGTFLNKYKIKPHMFVRLQVGHMLKLGMSTRMFILQGPPDDVEPESELSVTELKNLRLKEKLAEQLAKSQFQETKEDEGIDWGMGEDADEETDLSVNPFAAAPNEELYIDDPKKTLRGWFEREGVELIYDCQEKGFGQFVCRVELPIDDARGRPIVSEAIVKGKKKESVVQCALEACRLLDQHGLLRQSNHESRKKKAKDWEADDYYDSDEDSFLDRTGTVERKRQKRMQEAGVAQVIHTYPGLVEEHQRILAEVERVQTALTAATTVAPKPTAATDDELDQFMADLNAAVVDKGKVTSLKAELTRLKADEHRIRTLANIARPAGTQELLPPWPSEPSQSSAKPSKLPIIGKRRLPPKKVTIPPKASEKSSPPAEKEEVDEEFDSD